MANITTYTHKSIHTHTLTRAIVLLRSSVCALDAILVVWFVSMLLVFCLFLFCLFVCLLLLISVLCARVCHIYVSSCSIKFNKQVSLYSVKYS